MTLQQMYDSAVALGADPATTKVVVEYCNINEMRYSKVDNIIYID